MSNDEDFGFIKGQLQSIERRIQTLEEESKEKNKELSTKMDSLTEELAMYRHFVIWLRSSLLVAAFFITMKWGDLMDWINGSSGE